MDTFKNRHKCLFYTYFCIFMYSTGIYACEMSNISTFGFTHFLFFIKQALNLEL